MENTNDKNKKVDESWKETAEKEKAAAEAEATPGNAEAQPPVNEINFGLFLSGLMIEGLIALGDVDNPVTKTKEMNLGQAKYIIDIISILEEKTKNNLDPDEKTAIEQILYELRMRYVSKSKK